VELDGVLPVVCYVQCEQMRVVSERRLVRNLGRIDDIDMMRVERILRRLLNL
jgi:mRNA-degrading endonuclease toxin of MazEF toxin-antitoxin module